jgi:uncharacterized membrane protein YczE
MPAEGQLFRLEEGQVIRRIVLALAAGMIMALLPATAAYASSGLVLALSADVDRNRFPSSGFEIGLMAGAVVVLIVIGFLLRYLSRPGKAKEEARGENTPEDGTANGGTPEDEGV